MDGRRRLGTVGCVGFVVSNLDGTLGACEIGGSSDLACASIAARIAVGKNPMSDLVERARAFAIARHGDQRRKYTGEPYWHHLRNVAAIVETLGVHESLVAAAWLHDTVEDAGVTFPEIDAEFGPEVRELVFWLTDRSCPEDGNRKARKTIDRVHLGNASPAAQTVKLADLIDNAGSIVAYDKSFAIVYLEEKEQLLEVLTEADPQLRERAFEVLCEAQLALVRANLKRKEDRDIQRSGESAWLVGTE